MFNDQVESHTMYVHVRVHSCKQFEHFLEAMHLMISASASCMMSIGMPEQAPEWFPLGTVG